MPILPKPSTDSSPQGYVWSARMPLKAAVPSRDTKIQSRAVSVANVQRVNCLSSDILQQAMIQSGVSDVIYPLL